VVVTNGYLERKPLADLCSAVDAIKIDLKAFEDGYYRKICGARLDPVLRSLAEIRSRDVWLEIVYLMVPTLNDDPVSSLEMARKICLDAGLNYVYIGNVAGHEAGSTYCRSCSKKIIDRSGYTIRSIEMDGDRCRFCGTVQPGVWRKES
jgi:pyruvate formate lyase activating enzyme